MAGIGVNRILQRNNRTRQPPLDVRPEPVRLLVERHSRLQLQEKILVPMGAQRDGGRRGAGHFREDFFQLFGPARE